MAKEFYTEGTGSQQVLHESPTEKIPVYENKDAVEADFANLAENQLVATKDMGVDPSVVPVGFIVPQYRKVARKGWLYLDGSEFDENEYPALYLYLGTNVLPDYREFGLVGAEENTTSANIATHDVYTQGQEKDDQLQNITGSFEIANRNRAPSVSGVFDVTMSQSNWFALSETVTSPNLIEFDASHVARAGTVTRGKRKAVYYYIKAVDGEQIANESQFLTTVKNYLKTAESYSTEETLTGGTWIDGKPIYKKVVDCGAIPNATYKSVAHGVSLGTLISAKGMAKSSANLNLPLPYVNSPNASDNINIYVNATDIYINTAMSVFQDFTQSFIVLEYTKTTN